MDTMTAAPSTAWPISGQLLDGLSRRDFTALERCLSVDARMRALVPMGPLELTGAASIADRFRLWFGGDDAFEMIEASASDVGSKHYLRWRVRMTSAEMPAQSRVAEQHLYTTGTEAIETIDLLCSGFHAEIGEVR